MENTAILNDLLAILEQNGFCLRREALGGEGSGLCKIKGKIVFFVDTQAQAIETARSCAVAINELIDIEALYMRPELRQFIENCSGVENED